MNKDETDIVKESVAMAIASGEIKHVRKEVKKHVEEEFGAVDYDVMKEILDKMDER